MPNPVAAAILAGGKSTRMGQAKALLLYQDNPLIEHLASRLKSDVQLLFAVGCPQPGLYDGLSLPVILDQASDLGPLGGVDAALQYVVAKNAANAQKKNREPAIAYLLVLPCDGIQLPRLFVSRMVQILENRQADIVYAQDAEREQHLYCLMKIELQASLHNYIQQGGRKVIDWFHLHHYAVVDFSADGFVFSNLNTPDDWQQFVSRTH